MKLVRLLALVSLVPAASLFAQNEYETQVLGYLDEIASVATSNGYTYVLDTLTGSLAENASYDATLNLSAGEYAVVAVCDADCSDIDMALYDSSGNQVASDTETDDVPVLEFSTSGGSHRLSVQMYSCSSEPCYWAARVYGRSSGGAVAESAGGQTDYEAQVLGYLNEAGAVLSSGGYGRAIDTQTGSLAEGASSDITLNLAAGAYALQGVCDVDCSDLDLTLYDASGNQVASDAEPDDVPLLEISTGGGTHRLSVQMYGCSSEPCYWAVRTYASGSGSGGAMTSPGSSTGGGVSRPDTSTGGGVSPPDTSADDATGGRWVLLNTEFFVGEWQTTPPTPAEHYNIVATREGLSMYYQNRTFGSEYECGATWGADPQTGLGSMLPGDTFELSVRMNTAIAQNYPNGSCGLSADIAKENTPVGYVTGGHRDLFYDRPRPLVNAGNARQFEGTGQAEVPDGEPGENLYLRISLSPGRTEGAAGILYIYSWRE